MPPQTASLTRTSDVPTPPESVVTDKRAGREEWVAALKERDRLVDWWHPRAELVRALAEWGGDPAEILGVVIDAMSDRELRSSLTSLTSLTEGDLDEIRDLRAFTRRVTEVALDSVIGFGAPETASLAHVQFSQSVNPQNIAELAQERFASDGKIYAVFPMEEYRDDDVFVKWYRTDDPEILLFDRYPIQREADYNYVWLDKESGWPEGEYSVDFYSGDDAMKKIAAGRYFVDSRAAALDIE
ncbi:MAG: hypothetical protein HRU01_23620 [Myxococcales bacterium]|nr:hypothetical protein [Myxococcales bacterium]